MIGDLAWLALAVAAVAWQWMCRRTDGRHAGLGAAVAGATRSLPGWALAVALWALAGWHLFARYTIPR